MEQTHDGRQIKIIELLDKYTCQCLALVVASNIRCDDVLQSLHNLFLIFGIPEFIRSDNHPGLMAKAVHAWSKE